MELTELINKYIVKKYFIKDFTDIPDGTDVFHKINGKNSMGKPGRELRDEQQIEIAKGFVKLGDALKKCAEDIFKKLGVKP